jgi:hypothetical protein
LLKENGIKLYTENDIEELLKWHFVGVIFYYHFNDIEK